MLVLYFSINLSNHSIIQKVISHGNEHFALQFRILHLTALAVDHVETQLHNLI